MRTVQQPRSLRVLDFHARIRVPQGLSLFEVVQQDAVVGGAAHHHQVAPFIGNNQLIHFKGNEPFDSPLAFLDFVVDEYAGTLAVLGQGNQILFVVAGYSLEASAIAHDVVLGEGGEVP